MFFFQLLRYLLFSNLVIFSNKTCLLTCPEHDLQKINQELDHSKACLQIKCSAVL